MEQPALGAGVALLSLHQDKPDGVEEEEGDGSHQVQQPRVLRTLQ